MILKRLDSFNVALTRLLRKSPGYADTVIEFCTRFAQADSPAALHGANMHRIERAKSPNVWAAYASESIRIVLRQRGAAWYAAYVHSEHDGPYDWAERHYIDLPKTQQATGVELEQVCLLIEDAPAEVKGAADYPMSATSSCFDPFDDAALLELGVPRIMIPMLRRITTPDDFIDNAYAELPEELGDALFGALTGDFGAVVAGLGRAEELVQAGEPEEALPLQTPVIVEGSLDGLSSRPDLSWIALPDAMQSMIANSSFDGPVLVTGSAGTGKTVVGVHRAVHMAAQGKNVLFTTYTNALCWFLREHVDAALLGDASGSVHVSTVDRVGLQLSGESFDPDYAVRGQYDFHCRKAAERLASGEVSSDYDCVIVDEMQDLTPSQLSLTRALAGEGVDRLLLLGDTDQRIYGQPFDLEDLGFEFDERVFMLATAYRTTRQIQDFAAVMLDEGPRSRVAAPYAEGDSPRLITFGSREEETLWVALEIVHLVASGSVPSTIGILTRTNALKNDVYQRLSQFGVFQLQAVETTISTMHGAKGLEFDAVFVLDVDEANMQAPRARSTSDDEKARVQAVMTLELNLLHVAVSRATDRVFVCAVGTPSDLLDRALASGYAFEAADFSELAEFEGDVANLLADADSHAARCRQRLTDLGYIKEAES